MLAFEECLLNLLLASYLDRNSKDMRNALKRIYWIASAQFGFDLRKTIRSFISLPRYFIDYFRFKASYAGRIEFLPCLHDWHEENGETIDEYFWQDIYIAQKIFRSHPDHHVDIGSRVNGFIAHVASFREIEVIDIRPITISIPNVTFKQIDLMKPADNFLDYCDSLSCLHALEHFGLGRYGDPIDPQGHESGIRNMARMLRPGGILYLSVPVGISRVEFNGQRVFDPQLIIDIAHSNQLELNEIVLFSAGTGLEKIDPTKETLTAVGRNRYALGIFTFEKARTAN